MPGASDGGMDTTGPGAMDGFTGGLGLDSFGGGGTSFMPGTSGMDTTGPGAMDSFTGGLGGDDADADDGSTDGGVASMSSAFQMDSFAPTSI